MAIIIAARIGSTNTIKTNAFQLHACENRCILGRFEIAWVTKDEEFKTTQLQSTHDALSRLRGEKIVADVLHIAAELGGLL